MDDLFRRDFKEPRRPSAWAAVLISLAVTIFAVYVWLGGINHLADGLSQYIRDWEEKYDGVRNGQEFPEWTTNDSGTKVILPGPKQMIG
jgi:hypothetical protein